MNEASQTPISSQKKSSVQVIIAAVVIVVVLIILANKRSSSLKTDTQNQPLAQKQPPQDVQKTSAPALRYANGTYTAVGTYVSPGGPEEVGVSVTLTENVVTDVQFEQKATIPASQKFQKLFAENFQPLVVGKNIDSIVLDTVAGSSLTPKGFNDAIQQIQQQAQL